MAWRWDMIHALPDSAGISPGGALKHIEQDQVRLEPTRDTSMYAIGNELAAHLAGGRARGNRGRRGRSLAMENHEFDFASCSSLTTTAINAALLSRSAPALDYLALVIDELEQDSHLCAHLLNTLANSPDVFTCLTEVKRRCLLTKEFTHTIICRAIFLPDIVKVRVSGNSEIGTKQAAHTALIGGLCRELLLLDQPERP